MFKKMFLIRLFLIVICFVSITFGEFQNIDFANVANDNVLTLILRERLSRSGDTFTFSNAATIDNATNGAITFTEASEDLIWTFGTNKIAFSSSTSLDEIDFGSIFIEMAEISIPSNPGADTGRIYVKDVGTVTTLFFLDSSGNETSLIAAAGGNSLDGAYNAGNTIDVDTSPVVMTVSDTDNNRVLDIVQNDTTNDPTAMQITNAADAADAISLDIDAQSTGRDIEGTGATWFVTGAGALTAVTATIPTVTVATTLTASSGITLDSGDIISNATDTEIKFADTGGEDLILDLAQGTNAVGLKSDSGVDELAMGAVDDLTGVGTITFDIAASSITLPATGVGEDLTIEVTGAVNSSLILNAAGTAADALQIATSAGGMDITVAGSGDGEDLDILSGRSLTLTSSEATADAIKLNASAGGLDIDAVDDIIITVASTTGADDFRLIQTGAQDASISLEAAGTGADAIRLQASAGGVDIDAVDDLAITVASTTTADDLTITQTGGNNSGIIVTAAGTGADAIALQATAGGLDVDVVDDLILTVASTTGADDMRLIQTGAQDASISLEAAGTGADAIRLQASAGGIDIDAIDDLAINVASTTTADDLTITQTGANNSSIIVTAAGTGVDAISLQAAAGGIDIDAKDDLIILLTTTAADDDLTISTTGSDDTHITITADGTSANALGLFASGSGGGVDMDTASGPITITADGASAGDITIDAEDVIRLVTLDSVIIDGGPLVEDIEFLTSDGVNLQAFGASDFDTNAGPFSYALGSPALGLNAIGTMKVMTMSVAGNDADITVTNHATSDPEVFRFNAVDEALVLMWTGTEWITIANEGVDTP